MAEEGLKGIADTANRDDEVYSINVVPSPFPQNTFPAS